MVWAKQLQLEKLQVLYTNNLYSLLFVCLLSHITKGRLHNELNLSVLLGACDTFRAAAVEQLAEWAIRANVSIEKPLRKRTIDAFCTEIYVEFLLFKRNFVFSMSSLKLLIMI